LPISNAPFRGMHPCPTCEGMKSRLVVNGLDSSLLPHALTIFLQRTIADAGCDFAPSPLYAHACYLTAPRTLRAA
jgi:hypothetical protein